MDTFRPTESRILRARQCLLDHFLEAGDVAAPEALQDGTCQPLPHRSAELPREGQLLVPGELCLSSDLGAQGEAPASFDDTPVVDAHCFTGLPLRDGHHVGQPDGAHLRDADELRPNFLFALAL